MKACLSCLSTYSTVRPFRAAMRSCSSDLADTTTCDPKRHSIAIYAGASSCQMSGGAIRILLPPETRKNDPKPAL